MKGKQREGLTRIPFMEVVVATLYLISKNYYYECMKAIVSVKGQVTIPKTIRRTLGIRAGTVLEFTAEDGRLVAVKDRRDDAISRWRGKGRLPGGRSVDEYLQEVRG